MLAATILIIGIGLCLLASMQLTSICGHASHLAKERRLAQREAQTQADRLTVQLRARAAVLSQSQRAWQGWRPLTVVHIEDEAADCRSFFLRDPEEAPLPPFLPGQFLSVGLANPDGSISSRCYSLSDAPDARCLRLTVKRVPGGLISNRFHDEVRVADTIVARAPAGRFVPLRDPQTPLVLVAAGVGITPMVSIIRDCERWQPGRTVHLFYQVRDLEHAPLLKDVARWAAEYSSGRLHLFVSQPTSSRRPDWVTAFGRVDLATVLLTPGIESAQYMICGPPAMIDEFSSGLRAAGIAEEKITVEAFSPVTAGPDACPQQTAVSGPILGSVAFERSGRQGQCDASQPTILEAAEACGVVLESGCRSGDCGACLVRVTRGTVRYEREPTFGPLAEGEALACAACPQGTITIDA